MEQKQVVELAEYIDLETHCHLCAGMLIEGSCLAYHWNDSIHLKNQERIKSGQPTEAIEAVEIPTRADWGPCWACGADTDTEGRCTRVNDFFHDVAYASWMSLFHSQHEAENAPPVTFLIKDFLQCEGVTALAAPVRERKSLIALNIVHALLTGEKLFGYFDVVKKPKRVIYLCPEVSLGPFTDRVKKIGLLPHVGRNFFYRTMSADGHLNLSDESLQMALPGSVVFLDTAIRFLNGDENSSKDVRAFADTIFSLLKQGAVSVVLIHHSPKDSGDNMTLENAMRGSGDFGAFLACCWGTKLQDPSSPYTSTSFMSNLKQRDFESKDFELTCGPDCRMRIVDDPTLTVATLAGRKNRANKDGQEGKALEVLRANPTLSVRKTVQALKDAGIRRGTTWVMDKRYELMQDDPTKP